MFTPQQRNYVKIFMNGCNDYVYKLISYQASNYATGLQLSQDPELMDQFMNLYRTRDMCYDFLIGNPNQDVGHKLVDLTQNQIDNFLKFCDPISIVEFFQQDYLVADFILENELSKTNIFKNDQKYQTDYQNFIDSFTKPQNSQP